MMFYAILLALIGIILASIFVWKRRIHLALSLFLNACLPTILFIMGVYFDGKKEAAIDPSVGGAYSFLAIMGTPFVFFLSICFLLIVAGVEKGINGPPD